MDIDRKFDIVKRNTMEIVTEKELMDAFSTGKKLRGYIGFEPSGIVHIGWLIWMYKFKDLVDAGIEMILYAATWHAWINDKLGGNFDLIKSAARHVAKVMEAMGIDSSRFRVIYAEEIIEKSGYWTKMLKIAKRVSLSRAKRALTIMGRRAEEAEIDFAKLVYPFMQVADIFELDLDIALGGIDQRKAHMLARDIAEKLGWRKPIAIHTPLLPSLKGTSKMISNMSDTEIDDVMSQIKMSKSKPEEAILVTDDDEAIRSKIKMSHCPPREVSDNPIMAIARYIIFAVEPKRLIIEREPRYGGTIEIYTYEELEKLYTSGKLHPLDLKNTITEELIKIIKPIREALKKEVELWKDLIDIEKSITR